MLNPGVLHSTHQLAPEKYSKDCRAIAFNLIDQCVLLLLWRGATYLPYPSDDQVEEHNLAVGLEKTSKAWKVNPHTFKMAESLNGSSLGSVWGSVHALWLSYEGKRIVKEYNEPIAHHHGPRYTGN